MVCVYYIFFLMPPKLNKKRKNRVVGEMSLKELIYFKHTPLDVPSNEFKDEMDLHDAMHIGQPLALDDLHVSREEAKLRESVLNVNLDDMFRELDMLLKSSESSANPPKLKWVDALDQLYHDFLHRSKLSSPVYPGSPSPLSNVSANSQLGKRIKPKKPPIMINQWVNNIPERKHKNSPSRNITKRHNKRQKLTGSDIHQLTAKKRYRSQSSSAESNKSNGSLHLSEINSA